MTRLAGSGLSAPLPVNPGALRATPTTARVQGETPGRTRQPDRPARLFARSSARLQTGQHRAVLGPRVAGRIGRDREWQRILSQIERNHLSILPMLRFEEWGIPMPPRSHTPARLVQIFGNGIDYRAALIQSWNPGANRSRHSAFRSLCRQQGSAPSQPRLAESGSARSGLVCQPQTLPGVGDAVPGVLRRQCGISLRSVQNAQTLFGRTVLPRWIHLEQSDRRPRRHVCRRSRPRRRLPGLL